jgi:hypothetical protein
MQGSGWLSVLGKIPVQKHDCLAIVTTTGAEIVLREIVRVENDLLIVRGRMAGSTDGGRVIVLPFDQVAYLAFNKMLPEAEIHAMFSQSGSVLEFKSPQTATQSGPEAGAQPGSTPESATSPAPDGPRSVEPVTTPAGGKATAKPSHPSKSILLARLRARLSGENGGAPLGQ